MKSKVETPNIRSQILNSFICHSFESFNGVVWHNVPVFLYRRIAEKINVI
jgi:hypothetical protein